MHILDYIKDLGYKSYIFRSDKIKDVGIKELDLYEEVEYKSFYSSYGPLNYRWIKDGNIDGQIIYGLNEYGKPPTLIGPKPWSLIMGITDRLSLPICDDIMNRVLKDYSAEEIYNSIINGRDRL